jgi:NAD(P)-dependent dehydrogenase (short-subunit alcohol dehydrogenase family)
MHEMRQGVPAPYAQTLITGANRGLGYETARRLIGLGHTVLAGARDRQRGAEAARELGTAFIHIDPTDDGSVEAAAARVRSEYGHLDVLINNAGLRHRGWALRS